MEMEKPRHVSAKRLYSMVGPDWMYGIVGVIGAFVTGSQMPLFALGVSQALVAFYMDWDTTQHEIKKISLLFCGGAVLTVIFHAVEHLCFGIMGERLTLRVREMMFHGILQSKNLRAFYSFFNSFIFSKQFLFDCSYFEERDRMV